MLIPLDLSLVSAVVSTTCRLKPQVYCCHLCVAACSWLGYVLRLGLSLECAEQRLNTTDGAALGLATWCVGIPEIM